jgi:predicted nucleic acid-binding protein
VILLDTTVLVYAVGTDHPFRDPCRMLIEAVTDNRVEATTTVEVVQEFVHVRARRPGRGDAARLGRWYIDLLGPLVAPSTDDLLSALATYHGTDRLDAFDAVLAATAINHSMVALVSADQAFSEVAELHHVVPHQPAIDRLLGQSGPD